MDVNGIEVCSYCSNVLQRDNLLSLDQIVADPQFFRRGRQIKHVAGCPMDWQPKSRWKRLWIWGSIAWQDICRSIRDFTRDR